MKLPVILATLILALQFSASPASAQVEYDCIPTAEVCAEVYSEHWEFNQDEQICYQPFAQCGGSRFNSEKECLIACAHLMPTPILITPLLTPNITISPTDVIIPKPCTIQTILPNADANRDGKISLADFEIFRAEFTGESTESRADFNCDGKVSLADFEQFRQEFTQIIVY